MPKDENGMLMCACGSKTWYTREEITVTLTAAAGALSVTRSGGNHRPVPTTIEPVTRCTDCDGTMRNAVDL